MASTVAQCIAASGLPKSEAHTLAAHALNQPRAWLLAHDTDALTGQQLAVIQAVFTRRQTGEPLAYIQGFREFYGLDFVVSPSVLIPRPETELLVDWLIQHCPPQASLLDLGTGSGVIAVSVAHHRPDLAVAGCDISTTALAIAQQNNHTHAAGRVNMLQSDWFGSVSGHFDVIVSNPPYIAANDAHLTQGDLRFEPSGALTDAADGLAHYRHIISHARTYLKPNGWLVFEHGWSQGAAIQRLLATAGYRDITQYYDAAAHDEQGLPRMLVAQR